MLSRLGVSALSLTFGPGVHGFNLNTKNCGLLRRHQYVSMKICTTEASEYGQESRIYDHLRSLKSSHPGQRHIRPVYDTFELSGPYGLHSCLVHPPMHLTLLDFMRELPGRRRLDRPLLRLTLRYLLSALDFLHTEANVVHTGRRPPMLNTVI